MKKILFLLFLLSACALKPISQTGSASGTQSSTNVPVASKSPQEISNYESPFSNRGIDYSAPLTAIAFGSCANQDQPAPIWKTIADSAPDLFLFMGDNIYASSPNQKPISEQYRKLDLVPEYRQLREKVPFMATWDDHDYGLKDGGAEWQGKSQAQKDFLNYWSYVKNSIPLEQGGIYHSKIIGPKKQSIQIIMLDTRYHRSPLKEKPGHEGTAMNYEQQTAGTILGEAQWEWLEAQLRRPATVLFVVTSIQLIPTEPQFEKWDNFPKEREKFFDLIRKTRAKNVIILSGDRHVASISKLSMKDYGPLVEVTASALNRPNNYGDQDSHYTGPVYNKENFGLASIDWKRKAINIEIRNLKNEVVNSTQVSIR